VAKDDVRGLLCDALLQRLLEAVIVPSLFVERLVAFARRGLLEEFGTAPSVPPSLPLPAFVAMAHQCHATEYVHDETDAEGAGVAVMRAAIVAARTAGGPVPLHWYALYACYRPLHTLDEADAIAAELAASALASLATRQIREPLEEWGLRGTIAAMTPVTGEVSNAVRDQYEANPYPQWLRVERDVAQTSVAAFLRSLFPAADLAGLPDAPARILVAGCGTGRHPIGTARRFPDSSVLAVDLSLTSLAYAERKTRELGIGNIEYRQADILALGALAERFDVVDCTGVLHHLEDPVAGWRILCSLLRPGGAMRVGLYSEIARRHVIRARELIAAAGFAPTPSGIRACRAAILDRQDDALLARVTQGEDFYSLSGCRDLVFHVQEQRYTLPRIASMLAELDLKFIGFEWPDTDAPARYRARFPDDPALIDLDHWHRFETDRPDTFVLMYQFWVRKRTGSPAATGANTTSSKPPPSAR
jgi:2-polyprenyl-3-methyl-5-hydroxy-6-metoxy-1,4-benzoquinol methylase